MPDFTFKIFIIQNGNENKIKRAIKNFKLKNVIFPNFYISLLRYLFSKVK